MDLTATGVAVHHPTDAAEPDLPASPVLVVATSDAKLRFFVLSHTTRPLAGLVAPPTPVPAEDTPLAAVRLLHRRVCAEKPEAVS